MGLYLYFRVLIFTFLASFTQRMSIQSACIQQWFRFKLLANFDFYLCLRINFHTLSFWVLILAASGPYWVLISQKNGSLLGPYLKAWGSLLVLEAVQHLCRGASLGLKRFFRNQIFIGQKKSFM